MPRGRQHDALVAARGESAPLAAWDSEERAVPCQGRAPPTLVAPTHDDEARDIDSLQGACEAAAPNRHFTVTLSMAVVQQHNSPPPPSPE